SVNPEGLDFYRRLADRLLEGGIEPWVTLYHWDLPQALQDEGGWANRQVVDRFVDYAAAVYGALSDRVANWTTLNEPWCAAFLGHAAGIHAPGLQDPATAVAAAHHLLVAHGQATRAMRALDARPRLGINLNLDPVTPASADPADLDATRRIDGVYNRLFLDPLFLGRYPADVLEDLGGVGGLDRAGDADLAAIAAPLDLLGVNYYRRWVVAARPERPRLGGGAAARGGGGGGGGAGGAAAAGRPAVALGGRRGRRVRGQRPATHRPGLGDRPVGPGRAAAAPAPRLPVAAAVRDRERGRLRGCPRRPRPGPGPGPDPVPGRAPAGRPSGDPGRGRPAGLLRPGAAGQLRVGRGPRCTRRPWSGWRRGRGCPGQRCRGWSTAPPRSARPSGPRWSGRWPSSATCPTGPPAAWSPGGPTRSRWSSPSRTRASSPSPSSPAWSAGSAPPWPRPASSCCSWSPTTCPTGGGWGAMWAAATPTGSSWPSWQRK